MIPLLEAAEPKGCGRLVNVASMAGRLNQLKPPLAAKFADPALTLDGLNGLVGSFEAAVQAGTRSALTSPGAMCNGSDISHQSKEGIATSQPSNSSPDPSGQFPA